MQNIFAICTICTKIYIKMICFLAVYLKIITFAPTNMEKGRMILLRIAGRTTQGKAYFGKALSNLLSVKVIMSLIETCKAKYKFRLTLKVPHCFCCQQDTACRPHDANAYGNFVMYENLKKNDLNSFDSYRGLGILKGLSVGNLGLLYGTSAVQGENGYNKTDFSKSYGVSLNANPARFDVSRGGGRTWIPFF